MDRQHLRSLNARDAAVALRSYSRRIHELVAAAEQGDEDIDLAAPGRSGWSVLGLLGAAANHVAVLERAIGLALDLESPQVDAVFERPRPGTGGASPALALIELDATLLRLADRVERTPGKDWARAVVVGGTESDAHELLREVVAYGRTVLDELAGAVEDARRSAR